MPRDGRHGAGQIGIGRALSACMPLLRRRCARCRPGRSPLRLGRLGTSTTLRLVPSALPVARHAEQLQPHTHGVLFRRLRLLCAREKASPGLGPPVNSPCASLLLLPSQYSAPVPLRGVQRRRLSGIEVDDDGEPAPAAHGDWPHKTETRWLKRGRPQGSRIRRSDPAMPARRMLGHALGIAECRTLPHYRPSSA